MLLERLFNYPLSGHHQWKPLGIEHTIKECYRYKNCSLADRMGAKHAMRFVNCSGFAYERLVGNCALSIYQYCYGHNYSEKIVIKPKSFCYFIPRYIQCSKGQLYCQIVSTRGYWQIRMTPHSDNKTSNLIVKVVSNKIR